MPPPSQWISQRRNNMNMRSLIEDWSDPHGVFGWMGGKCLLFSCDLLQFVKGKSSMGFQFTGCWINRETQGTISSSISYSTLNLDGFGAVMNEWSCWGLVYMFQPRNNANLSVFGWGTKQGPCDGSLPFWIILAAQHDQTCQPDPTIIHIRHRLNIWLW